jgi:L-ascorbate metabolism protein UlaG (beta-lactamase superfamily)
VPEPFPRHFDGVRFFNPNGKQALGFRELIRWQRARHPEKSPRFVADVAPSKPQPRVEGDGLVVTLVNHSTVLIQHRGVNILTDPVWSERVSPIAWIGPKRKRAPGIALEDLPPIDIILLSHNHYDHLDLPTLRRLNARGKSRIAVPLGVGALVPGARELDWGGSITLAGIAIHAVPAYHFSARGPFDRNKTLWCGYFIDTGATTIYFAADTGFGDHFAQIRERFGAPRVALLPIGAYEPRWFMSPIHMGPDEAVRAHAILGARTSIAIHHGTFQLADDGLDTPKRELLRCRADDSFLVLNNGESVTL